MIRYLTGNLLESEADALVNTVNTVGVMGKGIALQFKQMFPQNFKLYAAACKRKDFTIGNLLVVEDESAELGKKIIINFPTKTDWRLPSEYAYIEAGLDELIRVIHERGINSIAIPALGAGNGGLDWRKVKEMIIQRLGDLPCDIQIFEPNVQIEEAMKKERVKLTPARAMLLAVLYDLVHHGEFVSEFAAEKIAYFLQRFGAGNEFKLVFAPNFYGPYSGKVKHVLFYLNGSYILGYSLKDRKPFDELSLVFDGEKEVLEFLAKEENVQFLKIVDRTKSFLAGFYSTFGLELLSSIDFLMQERKIKSFDIVSAELANWSNRKKTIFSNPQFIQIALDNLTSHLYP